MVTLYHSLCGREARFLTLQGSRIYIVDTINAMSPFDWDQQNREHIAAHGVTPEEAEQVLLNDPIALEEEIRNGEWRQMYLGETGTHRILLVVTCEIDELIRVVTAWPAKERLRAFWRTQQKGRSHGK
jgi:uncharacterized DUF497 family protein